MGYVFADDMSTTTNEPTAARAKTLDQLLKDTVPLFLSPAPCRETLRNWLDAANVPRFKANPTAKRGGGPVFYQVCAVEKFFRSRTMGVAR